jgi:uncharacterized protein (TIGR03437 family)
MIQTTERQPGWRATVFLCLMGAGLLVAPACKAQGSAITTYTITTVAGGASCCAPGDGGSATGTSLANPMGLALDSSGNFFFADTWGIRKVTPQGIISTLAGSYPYAGYSGDNGPALTAELDAPQGIAIDGTGILYIADSLNNRIRKVSTTGVITTVAGNGTNNRPLGDGGPAASATLITPWGIAVDAAGNLYISDTGNNRVRKVSNGIISTIAGNGLASDPSGKGAIGDNGSAMSAIVGTPRGLRVDSSGNVFVVDGSANRIRKITPGGIITTVAGNGVCCAPGSFSGDGGAATSASLNSPNDVAVDALGNLYIADNGNQRVRMVTPDGTITTIAGDGNQSYSGDNGPATAAGLGTPNGVAVRNDGAVYVSEISLTNGLVRLLTPAAPISGLPPFIRSANGVVSAGAYGAFPSIAPGTWIEIYGSNLAADSREWAGSDFNGVNAPTSLDGTSVTIGGQAAFIDYISSGQVNAQAPSNLSSGPQQVVVKTSAGSSEGYTVNVGATQPGLLAPASFNIGGTQYIAALFSDGVTYVLPPGAFPGLPSRRAQPGDTLTFYGVGFGAVMPNIPAGQIAQQNNTLAVPLQIKFGSAQAAVTYDGLAPGAVGSYQFDVVVPSIPSSDAVPVTFTLGGVAGTQTLYISVQNGNTTAQVQSLTLAPASVSGGGTAQGTVMLSTSAPTGGVVIALSSSSSTATVPATVTVPAGATSAAFMISTSAVSSNQTATISASYGGSSAQATLTVTGGLTLPQFSLLEISTPRTSAVTPEIVVENVQGVYTTTLTGVVIGSNGLPTLHYGAVWTKLTISGNTLTFDGLEITSSTMADSLGDIAQITSGSLTVTLNPQVVSTSGTVTGSLNLVSTITTVSGSFSGTYTAE